jgi:hypothetical protein
MIDENLMDQISLGKKNSIFIRQEAVEVLSLTVFLCDQNLFTRAPTTKVHAHGGRNLKKISSPYKV